MNYTLLQGDVIDQLRTLPSESVQACVTSPPYWGLRNYGHDGQIGLEETPQAYVAKMVAVFEEVRRVLRSDGCLWLNLGDSYGTGTTAPRVSGDRGISKNTQREQDAVPRVGGKAKQLTGIPWRVAFALQDAGWWLRSDIIWAKPNPMPESVKDRPTKAHEYIFLMTKSAKYYYDAEAIAEAAAQPFGESLLTGQIKRAVLQDLSASKLGTNQGDPTRNARDVWTIATQSYSEAHFATFPTEIPERCIKASTKPGDTVLDPFAGSGTTVAVAMNLGRMGIGIELNPEYIQLAHRRILGTQPALIAV